MREPSTQDIRIDLFGALIFRPALGQATAPSGIALLPRSLKSRTILFEIVPMLPLGSPSGSMSHTGVPRGLRV